MALGLGFFTTQWVACKTTGAYDIPVRSVVYISDIEYGSEDRGSSPLIATVSRPTSNNMMPIGVTGPTKISASGGYGYVALQGIALVDIASAPSLGVARPNWGSQAASFYPLENGIGLRTISVDTANLMAIVEVGVDLANLPITTSPKYAICLDSNGCLCKTLIEEC